MDTMFLHSSVVPTLTIVHFSVSSFLFLHESDLNWCLCKNISVWSGSALRGRVGCAGACEVQLKWKGLQWDDEGLARSTSASWWVQVCRTSWSFLQVCSGIMVTVELLSRHSMAQWSRGDIWRKIKNANAILDNSWTVSMATRPNSSTDEGHFHFSICTKKTSSKLNYECLTEVLRVLRGRLRLGEHVSLLLWKQKQVMSCSSG